MKKYSIIQKSSRVAKLPFPKIPHFYFVLLLGFGLALNSIVSAAPAVSKTWSGTWNNKKYGTSGRIVCNAKPKGSKWSAKFTGIALGESFKYGAKVKSVSKGSRLELTGVTTVDGSKYTWTGYIEGRKFVGRYRAANGYNGSFVMTEN